MGATARVETVQTSDFECDQCGKKETVAEVLQEVRRALGGDADAAPPAGWRKMFNAETGEAVYYHTNRCAVGAYRAAVRAVFARPRTAPKEATPSV